MGTPPNVLMATDTDAPVACGLKGSLIEVFKKTLVEGYGEKQPLGWTLEYENPEKTIAVFRNDPIKGNGVYLKVDYLHDTSGTVTTDTKLATISLYEVMTDIDTGVNLISKHYIRGSLSADANKRMWAIIGNANFFYIYLTPYNDETVMEMTAISTDRDTWCRRSQFFGIGDFKRTNETDGYNSVFGASTEGTHVAPCGFGRMVTDYVSVVEASHMRIARGLDGAAGAIEGSLLTGHFLHREQYGDGLKYVDGDPLHVNRPTLYEASSTVIRGHLPGLHRVNHSFFNSDLKPFQVVEKSGRRFLIVRSGYGYRAYVYQDRQKFLFVAIELTGDSWEV